MGVFPRVERRRHRPARAAFFGWRGKEQTEKLHTTHCTHYTALHYSTAARERQEAEPAGRQDKAAQRRTGLPRMGLSWPASAAVAPERRPAHRQMEEKDMCHSLATTTTSPASDAPYSHLHPSPPTPYSYGVQGTIHTHQGRARHWTLHRSAARLSCLSVVRDRCPPSSSSRSSSALLPRPKASTALASFQRLFRPSGMHAGAALPLPGFPALRIPASDHAPARGGKNDGSSQPRARKPFPALPRACACE